MVGKSPTDNPAKHWDKFFEQAMIRRPVAAVGSLHQLGPQDSRSITNRLIPLRSRCAPRYILGDAMSQQET